MRSLFSLAILGLATLAAGKTCTVTPPAGTVDAAPAIKSAFASCKDGGTVAFLNKTYHVESVMNITGLKDVLIDLKGTLLWGTNITYWLHASLPVGYQNQSTAFLLGGRNLTLLGHGYGTLNGNGQVWYDFVKGASNYPRRPHMLTVVDTVGGVLEGVRFLKAQMWTVTFLRCRGVVARDVWVDNLSTSGNPARNTDGANTLFSSNITFQRWTVLNGDDSIAVKANSSNILVEDCRFVGGLGLAIGSIGQYKGVYEFVDGVVARGVVFEGTRYAGYIKTWTGVQQGYPPNGGGGGLGRVTNIDWSNFTLAALRLPPFAITQCTSFSGSPTPASCDSSLLHISNLSIRAVSGTLAARANTTNVATFQCSAAAGGCANIAMEGVKVTEGGVEVRGVKCSHSGSVVGAVGFSCAGGLVGGGAGARA